MNLTEHTREFLEAYQLGKRFANNLRVGKRFYGSMPIARKLYKSIDSNQAQGFICGFGSVLKDKTICIHPDHNVITGFILSDGSFQK